MNPGARRLEPAAGLTAARSVAQQTCAFGRDGSVRFAIRSRGEWGRNAGRVAGYERYGRDILLRSVAVAESWRSTGIGARLTANRLAHALAQGCGAAYLLTDTARSYWERHGFSKIDRQAALEPITRSHEWSAACPVSATAMFRSLRES